MRLSVSASELMKHVEAPQLRAKPPRFGPGDVVRVTLRVPEGGKERVQLFEGTVIGRRGGGTREMVTVRRISFGVGVERTFPLHSPFVTKWELVSRGKARRAKLYYLRDRTGRSARLRRDYGGDEATAASAPAAESTAPAGAAAPTPAAKAAEAKAEAPKAEKAAKPAKAPKGPAKEPAKKEK